MSRVPLNDLSRLDPNEVVALTELCRDVLARGVYMRGSFTASLESNLAKYLDVSHVVGVANGTDALYLALAALGVREGDHVVTVANAGGYTSNAALRLGATPVFADIEPETGQLCPTSLRVLLDSHSGCAAVVMTHLYGLIGKIDEIAAVCNEYGVPLVEDCAQAIGARLNGRAAGTWGALSTFSFYPTKNLGGVGDGGAVATSNVDLADHVRRLAQYGWGTRYTVSEPGGINSRLDELQAAILSWRLTSVDNDNRRRREIVNRYAEALTGGRRILRDSSERFVAHLAVMATHTREQDAEHLSDAGIDTGIHYPVLDCDQPGWRINSDSAAVPNSRALANQILTLPCFPQMTQAEVERVCQAVSELR